MNMCIAMSGVSQCAVCLLFLRGHGALESCATLKTRVDSPELVAALADVEAWGFL